MKTNQAEIEKQEAEITALIDKADPEKAREGYLLYCNDGALYRTCGAFVTWEYYRLQFVCKAKRVKFSRLNFVKAIENQLEEVRAGGFETEGDGREYLRGLSRPDRFGVASLILKRLEETATECNGKPYNRSILKNFEALNLPNGEKYLGEKLDLTEGH